MTYKFARVPAASWAPDGGMATTTQRALARPPRRGPPWNELGELVHGADAGLSTLADRALAPLGVSSAQWKVLGALERLGAARVADLVELLRHDQAAVSRLASRLEGAGLVRRAAVPGDARSARLALTPRGRQVVRACRRRLSALMARVTAPLTRSEREHLAALLGRLVISVRRGQGSEQLSRP
jgi:DNA-binding MarR family transcriptional regulator